MKTFAMGCKEANEKERLVFFKQVETDFGLDLSYYFSLVLKK